MVALHGAPDEHKRLVLIDGHPRVTEWFLVEGKKGDEAAHQTEEP